MHIVHIPADGTVDGVEYTTATDLEDPESTNPVGPLAVFGIWFKESDCESIEDEAEQTTCLEERKPSDDLFTAMACFAGGDCGAEFD